MCRYLALLLCAAATATLNWESKVYACKQTNLLIASGVCVPIPFDAPAAQKAAGLPPGPRRSRAPGTPAGPPPAAAPSGLVSRRTCSRGVSRGSQGASVLRCNLGVTALIASSGLVCTWVSPRPGRGAPPAAGRPAVQLDVQPAGRGHVRAALQAQRLARLAAVHHRRAEVREVPVPRGHAWAGREPFFFFEPCAAPSGVDERATKI